MADKFTSKDYCRAAKALGCTPIDIKTVSGVEAPKGAFTPDGFPTILYERHVFWAKAPRNKRQQWFKDHPDLCNPNTTPRGGYGTPAAQRKKLERAMLLDESTALKACSWGAFQELGMNYADVGFATVQDFVEAMKSSASAQLDIFVKSIQRRGLQRALREHKWDNFALNYNGAGYRKWGYVPALEAAYKKASKTPIDCSSLGASTTTADTTATDSNSPIDEPQDTSPPTNIETEVTQNADTIINEESLVDKTSKLGDKFQSFQGVLDKFGFSIEDAKRSIGTVLLIWGKALFAMIMTALGVLLNHWELFVIAGLLLILAYLIWDRSGKRVAEAKAGMPVDVAKELLK